MKNKQSFSTSKSAVPAEGTRKKIILKVGAGLLIGFSNDTDQKGKNLRVCDGETVIAMISLKKAFPDQVFIDDEGNRYSEPGMVIKAHFVHDLNVTTDGEVRTYFR